MSVAPNAITRRLEILTAKWEDFSSQPEARICRWLVEPEEFPVIETFYEQEANEGGQIMAFFLRFDQAFTEAQAYSQGLQANFRAMIEEDRERLLKEDDIDFQWKTEVASSSIPHNHWLIKDLADFAQQVLGEEILMVAYLSPEKNDNIEAWKIWLMDSLEAEISENVRLMIVDTTVAPIFDQLATDYPDQLITIKPDLNMAQAMKEIAAMGNPAEPGVKYRMAFVALTQSAAVQDWDSVQTYANQCKQIAKEQQWPHLHASVFMTIAGAQVGAQIWEGAINNYEQAISITQSGYEDTEEEVHLKLMVQAFFGMGTVFISQKRYKEAEKIYLEAVKVAQQLKDIPAENESLETDQQPTYYEMEAWRMAAYCNEIEQNYKVAWDYNQNALETGEGLPKKDRPHTTLPYIGQALIKLAPKTGRSTQKTKIREEIDELLGSGWEQMIPSN